MDILIEILIEVYMELMFLIVPEEKRGRKHRIIVGLIALAVMIGLIALAIWGCYLIEERKNSWGYLPLIGAIVLSAAQIIAGIILFFKRKV